MTGANAFKNWIGRTDVAEPDTITPRLAAGFEVTFAPHLAETGDAAAGLHWCLSPPSVAADGLSEDGHPAKGGFLPPVPLPRRMWASSEVEFLDPLHVDDTVTRRSIIRDVTFKEGKSGQLCFVTVEHEYRTERGPAIRETQSIVYRAAACGPAQMPSPVDPLPVFDTVWEVGVTTVMLFRYSALGFNGHRIHYDKAYATDVEFYRDVVVHGPLQATLLLNLAAAQGKGCPRRFSFRGLAPATGAQTLSVGANSAGAELAIISAADFVTMTARAEW